MTITSVKAFFEAASGKLIQRQAFDMMTIDDWENFKENVKASLINQGCENPDEVMQYDDSGNLSIGTQFFMKPKVSKIAKGTLTPRSKDYIFSDGVKQSHGSIKGLTINQNGDLVRTAGKGFFVYSIL